MSIHFYKKHPAIVLVTLVMISLTGCNREEAAETTTEPTQPVTAAQPAEQPPAANSRPNALTPEERAARKEERQARREQRLAELTPEQLAAREARRAERQARKQENQNNAGNDQESEADKQARRADRRRQNINQRTQEKAWWNKGGNQLADMNLTDQQKTDMDAHLQALLDTREQLGAELQPLWQSNKDALASGNVGLIASNLERIDSLENQWQTERRNTMVEILESLDSQQLAALAQSSSDIATLNWLDIELGKGVGRPQTDRQQRRQNRRQNRNDNND